MAVITYSTKYPSYHPKKGQPTNFVEKFLRSVGIEHLPDKMFKEVEQLVCGAELGLLSEMIELFAPKGHTIRKGHRWKAGDYFSPRVWGNDINPKSGRSGPYYSKQIIIAPDTLIIKTWNFEIKNNSFYIDGRQYDGETEGHFELLETLAKNDGLSKDDLLAWFKFPKHFDGQIICWDKSINY